MMMIDDDGGDGGGGGGDGGGGDDDDDDDDDDSNNNCGNYCVIIVTTNFSRCCDWLRFAAQPSFYFLLWASRHLYCHNNNSNTIHIYLTKLMSTWLQ